MCGMRRVRIRLGRHPVGTFFGASTIFEKPDRLLHRGALRRLARSACGVRPT